MKNLQNESKADRIIRTIAGLLMFFLSYRYFSGTIQAIGFIVGAILIFTGLTGFCLIYKILKIKTN